MRSKKALISIQFAAMLQVVNIISALIIPRLIIMNFGSSVNGLISSITQFLGYISLLQLGVGGVVRAALYQPLAESNIIELSRVVKATEVFFRKIALISGVYIGALAFIFPYIVNVSFDFKYILFMVIILGLNTCMQYFFGIPYKLLVMADQKLYIYDISQILAITLNIIATVLLINRGCSIHLVKLASSVVFIIQPIMLNYYVSRTYHLNQNVKADNATLEQKWAGMGYSIADFVHRKTDILILTIFSSLEEVSVYTVYSVITNGLNSLVAVVTNSFQAALGDMLAKKEDVALKNAMDIYITTVHIISGIIFSVAFMLIIPFINLYTYGVSDAEYIRPWFAIFILFAELFYCVRQPYESVMIAAGKFSEIKKGAISEAILNILISLVLVTKFGIIGVAIGTMSAMVFRTLVLFKSVSEHIMKLSCIYTVKRYFITFTSAFLSVLISLKNLYIIDSYTKWILYATVITMGVSIFVLLINFIFDKKTFIEFVNRIKQIVKLLI